MSISTIGKITDTITVTVHPHDIRNVQITNADRIRAMTDEELAVLLSNTEANFPPSCQDGVSVKLCETAWLDWLKQEENK